MKNFTTQEIDGLPEMEVIRLAVDLGIPGARAQGATERRQAVKQALQDRGHLTNDGGEAAAPRQAPTGPAPVALSYPPHRATHNLAGQSVQRSIEMFEDAWSIDRSNLRVYVNGSELPRDRWNKTTYEGGERVEFHRPSGEKGDDIVADFQIAA